MKLIYKCNHMSPSMLKTLNSFDKRLDQILNAKSSLNGQLVIDNWEIPATYQNKSREYWLQICQSQTTLLDRTQIYAMLQLFTNKSVKTVKAGRDSLPQSEWKITHFVVDGAVFGEKFVVNVYDDNGGYCEISYFDQNKAMVNRTYNKNIYIYNALNTLFPTQSDP